MDTFNEEMGWTLVPLHIKKDVPLFLNSASFQISPEEIMIIGGRNVWYKWNILENTYSIVNFIFLPTEFYLGSIFYLGRKIVSFRENSYFECDLWKRKLYTKTSNVLNV